MLKKSVAVLFSLSLFALVACDGPPPAGPRYLQVRPYHEGLALVQATNGKWGYINEQQQWVILPRFDEAHEFQGDKAAACKDGKCGFINKRGGWL